MESGLINLTSLARPVLLARNNLFIAKYMKKAVLYARVSSEHQRKEQTIDSQILALKKQIADAGDILAKEYIDNGFSGAQLDRPGLDQLRIDIKTNLFDTIYFHNTDRIARDVTTAYQPLNQKNNSSVQYFIYFYNPNKFHKTHHVKTPFPRLH